MTDYLITDAIPAHTTYVGGSGGTENAGVVTFENLNIASGETQTVSFSVLVDDNLTDVEFISNVALVKSLPEDPGTETYPPLIMKTQPILMKVVIQVQIFQLILFSQ